MQYSHQNKQATEYAKSAFNRMKKLDLAPTPIAFEVWYVYFSGQSPEIKRAIDVLIDNNYQITADRCSELFQRYLSQDRDEEIVVRTGNEINETIRTVTGAVKNVRNATTNYTGKLGTISARIDAAGDNVTLKSIMADIITDTETMMIQNEHLEQELDKSSAVMEELQRNLESVKREAMTDGLTGLANRKAFDSEIMRVRAQCADDNKTFSLLMMDIDHFKGFNDNFGHQIGDQVLRLVAQTLTDGVKGRDIAARYGGEEFAILLPDTSLKSALIVGDALRKAVETKEVINRSTGEKLSKITISAGAAEYHGNEDLETLIDRADSALYTAKHNGRNQVAAAPTPSLKSPKK